MRYSLLFDTFIFHTLDESVKNRGEVAGFCSTLIEQYNFSQKRIRKVTRFNRARINGGILFLQPS